MPNNTKDNNGGKSHPTKNATGGNKTGQSGPADKKSGSPAGSQGKGEKKTTP